MTFLRVFGDTLDGKMIASGTLKFFFKSPNKYIYWLILHDIYYRKSKKEDSMKYPTVDVLRDPLLKVYLGLQKKNKKLQITLNNTKIKFSLVNFLCWKLFISKLYALTAM